MPIRSVHSCKSADSKRTIAASKLTTSAREYSSEASAAGKAAPATLRLSQDDLFHPFSESPVPEFRRRAAFMRQHAYCPHPDHKHVRAPIDASAVSDAAPATGGDMPPANVDFECPDCGIAVYCSKEHWMDDYENHLKICDTLRQINEDEHDLRSGRVFHEGNLPDLQMENAAVNMTNWDTFMYTREFEAVDSDRSMRQITRLLTYPITIGSVLHELSPYTIQKGGRLTVEGLKSFSGKFRELHIGFVGQEANVMWDSSFEIQSAHTKIWTWCWRQPASPGTPTSEALYSRCTSRIVSSATDMGAAGSSVPRITIAPHLHRTGEHGQPG